MGNAPPERMKENYQRWKEAYEKRCSRSNSWIVKRLKTLENEWRKDHVAFQEKS